MSTFTPALLPTSLAYSLPWWLWSTSSTHNLLFSIWCLAASSSHSLSHSSKEISWLFSSKHKHLPIETIMIQFCFIIGTKKVMTKAKERRRDKQRKIINKLNNFHQRILNLCVYCILHISKNLSKFLNKSMLNQSILSYS